MSAAIQPPQTARERLLKTVLDQLIPMYAAIYEGDMETARQAAADAMDPYVQDDRTDLAVAGQIIACGLTSMRIFQNCMRSDVTEPDLARLIRTADTLSRTAQRHRTCGLYPPAEPKPAANRAPNLRVVPTPPQETQEPQAQQPDTAPAPETGPLTKDEYIQIHRATKSGRLGEILSGDAAPADRAIRDRILALSEQAGVQPEAYIFSTTGIPSSPK